MVITSHVFDHICHSICNQTTTIKQPPKLFLHLKPKRNTSRVLYFKKIMWNPCINHISCQTFVKSICNQTRLALPATQTTQYLPPLLNIDTHGLYCRRKKRMFCKKENKQLNFCYSMIYHHVISCRNWTFLDFYLYLFFFFLSNHDLKGILDEFCRKI